jgi:hypothetical protein
MQFSGNILSEKLTCGGSTDALRTVVTHRQLLQQRRKLPIPSLEASSVQLLPFTLLADIRNEDVHRENFSLHVGPGLGVVLE